MFAFGKSDVGLKRKNNEDSFFISENSIGPLKNLFIVADGLGGHQAGEVASAMSIEFFCEFVKENTLIYTQDFLGAALRHSNTSVYLKSLEIEEYAGMGTTLTCVSIDENHIYFAHAGDSRLYIVKDGNLVQKSEDHSFYNELLEQGWAKRDIEARADKYRLTRAVGTDREIKVDIGFFAKEGISHILLCTDGLTDMLKDNEILEIINSNSTEIAAHKLVEKANELGGYDNISLVLIQNEVN